MDIPAKVAALQLPVREFVVIGSSSMAVLGLIDESNDIDLAVSAEVFTKLLDEGWQTHAGHGGKPVLRQGIFDVGIGYGEWDLEELLKDAYFVDGIPFMSMAKLLKWTQVAGRKKDAGHIAIIQNYLAGQKLAL